MTTLTQLHKTPALMQVLVNLIRSASELDVELDTLENYVRITVGDASFVFNYSEQGFRDANYFLAGYESASAPVEKKRDPFHYSGMILEKCVTVKTHWVQGESGGYQDPKLEVTYFATYKKDTKNAP